MMQAPELPLWAAILVGLCVLVGAAFTLIGTIGLVRMANFFDRLHSPTINTSFGIGFVLVASALTVSLTQQRLILHEILLLLFVIATTPVTLMSLGRAALFRKTTGE